MTFAISQSGADNYISCIFGLWTLAVSQKLIATALQVKVIIAINQGLMAY